MIGTCAMCLAHTLSANKNIKDAACNILVPNKVEKCVRNAENIESYKCHMSVESMIVKMSEDCSGMKNRYKRNQRIYAS